MQDDPTLLRDMRPWVSWFSFDDAVRVPVRSLPDFDEYVDRIVAGCVESGKTLEAGEVYHRARIAPIESWEDDSATRPPDEMTAPPADMATPGRLNPKGTRVLYMASDPETAIAEMRPWRWARIDVVQLKIVRSLRVADLRGLTWPESVARRHPARTFGLILQRPHHEHDPDRFAGSQYVAERIRAEGVDGVLYGSAMNPDGYNVALFDADAAEVRGPNRRRHVVSISLKLNNPLAY